MPDPRELPMVKFRRVRAGWYTLPIVSFDAVMQQIKDRVAEDDRKVEEHVDVSREKCGELWVVSTRGGRDGQHRLFELNQYSLFRSTCQTFNDAKRYAVALKAYLSDTGPNPEYLHDVFSEEKRVAFEAEMEERTGMPYAVWEAKIMGKCA